MLTITTAATDTTLLTLSEITAAVGGNPTVPQMDALNASVSACLARAAKLATSGATPPTFREEVLTEVFRQECTAEYLILSRRPVISITSVVEDGVTLETDEYEVDAATGLLYRLCSDDRTYWPAVKLTIVYTAGWATVPYDLKTAAIKTARILWSEDGPSGRAPGLKRERVDGVGEWEYWVAPASDNLLSAEIMDLLGPYIEYRGV